MTVANVTLTSSSLVLATIQNSVGVWVTSAVPSITASGASSFQINLNKAPGTSADPKTAIVAWFIVN